MSRSRLGNFLKGRDGAMSWFGIVNLLVVLVVLGLGIDVSNLMHQRTQLQVAADAAAHAALYTRQTAGVAEARSVALSLAEANMPKARAGQVLRQEDIVFGRWNTSSLTFTPDASSRQAVQVLTRQVEGNGNAVRTFLLRLVGLNAWDVQTVSVFATEQPHCFRDGFVSEVMVDLQGNNSFRNRFCIHSNRNIKFGSNNNFERGVNVSLPREQNLQLPASGFSSNIGLRDALIESRYDIKVLKQLPGIIERLKSPTNPDRPAYITRSTVVTMKPKASKIEQTDLVEGAIHLLDCSKGGPQVNVASNTLISRVVIVTNCQIKFEQGVALENAIFASTSTDPKSFNGPSGVRLGKVDNCAAGGGAQLLTLGGVDVASGMQMHGSQIIALGNVSFSADGGGLMGASIIAGGTISGTSNMTMGLCLTGLEDNIEAKYFRMVF